MPLKYLLFFFSIFCHTFIHLTGGIHSDLRCLPHTLAAWIYSVTSRVIDTLSITSRWGPGRLCPSRTATSVMASRRRDWQLITCLPSITLAPHKGSPLMSPMERERRTHRGSGPQGGGQSFRSPEEEVRWDEDTPRWWFTPSALRGPRLCWPFYCTPYWTMLNICLVAWPEHKQNRLKNMTFHEKHRENGFHSLKYICTFLIVVIYQTIHDPK